MSNILLFGLLPPLILMVYVYKLDKIEHEPVWLLIKIFVLGCVSTFPAIVLEVAGEEILANLGLYEESWLYLVLDYFLVVAVSEELCKRFAAKRLTWKDAVFNYQFDAVVYSVAAALGFAAAENILYMTGNPDVALARLIPVHTICGIFMGHYMGLAKHMEKRGENDEAKAFMNRSLLIPVLIHGFYDFCLSTGNEYLILACLAFITFMTAMAFRSLRKYAREDVPLGKH